MIFTGHYSTDTALQSKALKDVELFIQVLEKRDQRSLFKIAQKSWRRKHRRDDIFIPEFIELELTEIDLYSPMMVFAMFELTKTEWGKLKTEKKRVVFIAEKRPYKLSDKSMLRFNPVSLMKILK